MNKVLSFISKVKEFHPLYEIDPDNYINARTYIEVICPFHGSFYALPTNLIRGTGCKKCSLDRLFLLKMQRTSIKFESVVNLNTLEFNYVYDYSLPISYKSKISVTCQTHGKFFQSVDSIISGSKCPMCFDHRKKAPGGINKQTISRGQILGIYCYFLKITINNSVFYKIGLSVNIKNRISHISYELNINKSNVVILAVYTGCPLDLYNMEQYIVKKYSTKIDIFFKGYTEIVSCYPLEDINNFIKNTDIRLTTEYE